MQAAAPWTRARQAAAAVCAPHSARAVTWLDRAPYGPRLAAGPMAGLCDPSGYNNALFAFFAGMTGSEREYIREKTLDSRASARERGRHGGRPKVFDDDMLTFALALRAKGVSVPQIRTRLKIGSGKNAGERPLLASLYRALVEAAPKEWSCPSSAARCRRHRR